MIGYLVEQELANALPQDARIGTLLTQIEVDRADPAFGDPRKPIGPIYESNEAREVARLHSWPLVEESKGKWRRVVASPLPGRITQIETIRLLVESGVIVICAGGGGIPVIRNDEGDLVGIEAVIDKDRAAGLLAEELSADAFLMLTDVEAVYENWGTPKQAAIQNTTPAGLAGMSFAAGSMGPKVDAACAFASNAGRIAGIGRLEDARAILEGRRGTTVRLPKAG